METVSEMKKWFVISLSLILLTGCQYLGIEKEIELPMNEVPAIVIESAQNAVPGIELTDAEIEIKNGVRVYELEGTFEGKSYEIEISEAGEVLEVETEEESDQ